MFFAFKVTQKETFRFKQFFQKSIPQSFTGSTQDKFVPFWEVKPIAFEQHHDVSIRR